MAHQFILVDREALLAELQQVFDAHTAEVLLSVLDKVAAQTRRAVATKEDVVELRQAIAELAEAQRRTEEAVQALAEAQRGTEAEVQEFRREWAKAQQRTEEEVRGLREEVGGLREAQQRTEEEVRELREAQQRTEEEVRELREAQRRTEEEVRELREAQRRTEEEVRGLREAQRRTEARVAELAAHVGSLANLLGPTWEEEARTSVEFLLRKAGVRWITPLEPILEDEWDAAGEAEWQERPVEVRMEAKVSVNAEKIQEFAHRARRLADEREKEIIAIFCSMRIYRGAREEAQRQGVVLIGLREIRDEVPPVLVSIQPREGRE